MKFDRMTIFGIVAMTLLVYFWMKISPSSKPEDITAMSSQEKKTTEVSKANWEITNPATEERQDDLKEEIIKINTAKYSIDFSTKGAVVRSMRLNEHKNLEMVDMQEGKVFPFSMYIGDKRTLIDNIFQYQEISDLKHSFKTRIKFNGDMYSIEKVFTIDPKDYVINLNIEIKNEAGKIINWNDEGIAYSLFYGPQMGPHVEEIGKGRQADDTRTYRYYDGKRVRNAKLGDEGYQTNKSLLWAGIVGKYFATVGIPPRGITTELAEPAIEGVKQSSILVFKKRSDSVDSTVIKDHYYYYIGPKLYKDLAVLNDTEKNSFNIDSMNLQKVISSYMGLRWIENILQKLLQVLYLYVYPNYGIAIIIAALIIRLILLPLTLKSYKSTSRLQDLQPKIKDLQSRYKDDPIKLQQETGALYKKEGVNPLGGCLPILFQMPIIIAMADLFYKDFDFRGAVFIPHWIEDLSRPEAIFTLSLNFSIPFIGSELILRVLPILYLGTQLLMSFVMQKTNPNPGQTSAQTRIFTIYMPIIFFFILYNMPSGLLMYWTMTNILVMIQQVSMIEARKMGLIKDTVKKTKKKSAFRARLEEAHRLAMQEKNRRK